MPAVSPLQTSFNSGEFSPLMSGQIKYKQRPDACASMQNLVPLKQGPATRRGGTRYVAEVKTSANYTRLLKLDSSSLFSAYQIEFGDLYCRFYKNNGQVLNVGVPYEIVSPYAVADIPTLKFQQTGSLIYITHPNYAPRSLTCAGDINWTFRILTLIDGPYLPLNTLSNNTVDSTITVSSSTTTVGSVTTLTANKPLFTLVTDVGRIVRMKVTTNWGYVLITAVASTTSATGIVQYALDGTTASFNWRLGLYGDTMGYPSCIGFVGDRVALAGQRSYPSRVDASVTGAYTPFAIDYGPTLVDGTVPDERAFTRTLSGNNAVLWMAEDSRGLLCGTTKNEWLLGSTDLTGALTPTNARTKRVSGFGSKNIQGINIDYSTIFIQKSGRKIGELSYQFQRDSFQCVDLALVSEHITRTGVTDFVYQQDPLNVLWMALTNGTMIGLTYLPDQTINGFHRHIVGGVFNGGNAVVESLSTTPSTDGTRDEVWMIVKRTINGATKRYVEYMERYYESDIGQANAICMDSASTYSGAAASTITGLGYLEGQTVKLLVNGASHPDRTVSGGSISLDGLYTPVQVGLPNKWILQTLPPEAGSANGTAQGKTKRVTKFICRFLNTLGFRYGRPGGVLDEEVFGFGTQTGQATPLYSGDKTFPFPGGNDTNGDIYMEHDGPFPMTLTMLGPQLETQDGV